MIHPEDDGKVHRPDMIVDDGGDRTILIHEVNKSEDLFFKNGAVPDPSSTDNDEFNIVQTIIKRQIKGGETDKWGEIVNRRVGVSEDASTRVNHM